MQGFFRFIFVVRMLLISFLVISLAFNINFYLENLFLKEFLSVELGFSVSEIENLIDIFEKYR